MKNRIELTNEVFIILCEMYLFIYSDMVNNPEFQYNMSFQNIKVIIAMLGFNLVFVLYYSLRSFYFLAYYRILIADKWYKFTIVPGLLNLLKKISEI